MKRSRIAVPGLLLACSLAFLAACSGTDTVAPDPTLTDLVGDWTATSIELSSVADPSTVVDAIAQGASFFMNVQPSGSYTVGLAIGGLQAADVGELEVSGDRLIFHSVTTARTDTATFELSGEVLRFSGSTVYDFDGDQIFENANLEATLERDGS